MVLVRDSSGGYGQEVVLNVVHGYEVVSVHDRRVVVLVVLQEYEVVSVKNHSVVVFVVVSEVVSVDNRHVVSVVRDEL